MLFEFLESDKHLIGIITEISDLFVLFDNDRVRNGSHEREVLLNSWEMILWW